MKFNNTFKLFLILALALCYNISMATPDPSALGATISPSPAAWPVVPGQYETFSVNINNNGTSTSDSRVKFTISLSFLDFAETFDPAIHITQIAGNTPFTFTYDPVIKVLTASLAGNFAQLTGNQFQLNRLVVQSASPLPNLNIGANVNITTPSALNSSTNNDNTNNYTYSVVGTLPVSFTSFTGTANNCNANLKWSTATEQNSKRFDVLQSVDGANWTVAATVAAAGNSSNLLNYTSTIALIGSTPNYFKISEYDIDGHSQSTGIVKLSCASGTVADGAIKVYPNPAQSNITVNLPAAYSTANLAIFDNSGRRVMVSKGNGSTTLPLNISNLAQGTYLIVADNATDKKIIKFVKTAN